VLMSEEKLKNLINIQVNKIYIFDLNIYYTRGWFHHKSHYAVNKFKAIKDPPS
jgi:hypothetical protein